jgi:hypothetical protein
MKLPSHDGKVNMRMTAFLLPIVLGIASTSSAQLVQIPSDGHPDPNYCQNVEDIAPNLTLPRKAIMSGQIRDASLAPIAHSKVALRHYVSNAVQTPVAIVETDGTGHFIFGPAEPGEYRLLASPARWAAQPEKLNCPATGERRLDIVLKINGTDLPLSQCPIR